MKSQNTEPQTEAPTKKMIIDLVSDEEDNNERLSSSSGNGKKAEVEFSSDNQNKRDLDRIGGMDLLDELLGSSQSGPISVSNSQ